MENILLVDKVQECDEKYSWFNQYNAYAEFYEKLDDLNLTEEQCKYTCTLFFNQTQLVV